MKLRSKVFIHLVWVVFLLAQWGCVKQPGLFLYERYRKNLGTIGVISARYVPQIEFDMPPDTLGEGIWEGAKLGSRRTLENAGGCSGEGIIMCLAVLLALGILGGLGGGVYGAFADRESPETVEGAEGSLHQAIAALNIQETFRDHFLQKAITQTGHPYIVFPESGPQDPDEPVTYRGLREQGVDTILELRVKSVELSDESLMTPFLSFRLTVQAALIALPDETVWYDHPFTFTTKSRFYTAWAADNAKLFLEALTDGYKTLTQQIVEDLFSSSAPPWPFKVKNKPFIVLSNCRQPSLHWPSFDPHQVSAGEAQVTNIKYDLRIWRVHDPVMNDSDLGEPDYVRLDLPEPIHHVEAPLTAYETYFWSVRATFRFAGQPRVTEWANPTAHFPVRKGVPPPPPIPLYCNYPLVPGGEFIAKVSDVPKGGILKVRKADTLQGIRLVGLSCPTDNQPFEEETVRVMWDLTNEAKTLVVLVESIDKDGGILGKVLLLPERKLLHQELIKKGLCRVDRQQPVSAELEKLEAEAKAAKRGLWAELQ